jgi:type II secretion system protein G
MKRGTRGFTLIELLIVVAIIGLISAIAIPNLLNAIDKSKQKRTMSDLRAIGTAIETYAVEQANYPISNSAATLQPLIDPVYIKNMPMVDGWANTFQSESSRFAYTIYSQGKDGAGNNCAPALTSTFNDEICFSAGEFLRLPVGPQQ